MRNISSMKRTLTMLERVFLPEPELERKPGYYRLDYGTMTQPEKDTVKEALEQNEQISLEAMKEQKVTRRFDVDYSNVKITQDQHSLLVMADAVFQKHAVSPKEYSRRYPIH